MMSFFLEKYFLNIKGLKEESCHYTFPIGRQFFKQFDLTKELEGEGIVNVLLEKKNNEIIINMHASGVITANCDICLDRVLFPIENQQKTYVKVGVANNANNDNIIWISRNEHQVNIAYKIFEAIILNLPIRFSHTENGEKCNPEMIKLLNSYGEKKYRNDPRWDGLKKIINKY